MALIFLFYYITNYWQENPLTGLISLLFPSLMVFGLGYGLAYGLAGLFSKNNPELESLELAIQEKVAYLDENLRIIKEIEKRHQTYWLNLNGWQFEKEIANKYEDYGYDAIVTKGSGDGGIDIFLEKDGLRYGVQCKNHRAPVGPSAVRDLFGAMAHEKLDGGVFIASTGYTKGAIEFARNKPIQLLDINDVLKM